jgi:hypothetical protein
MTPEIVGIIVAALVALWVYTDAQRRALPLYRCISWGIFTLGALIVALPLYLILRPKPPIINK